MHVVYTQNLKVFARNQGLRNQNIKLPKRRKFEKVCSFFPPFTAVINCGTIIYKIIPEEKILPRSALEGFGTHLLGHQDF